jgi:KaiC/GvpD/RAD55 family RecA-like ATPase
LPPDNPVSIPLLTELIPDGINPGTPFLVEFDPESEWLAVATTITAGYLRAGGRVAYIASIRSPEVVKEELAALGVDIPSAISENHFLLYDWYSATLTGGRLGGGDSSVFEYFKGGGRARSLKVADLSVAWLKASKEPSGPEDIERNWPPGALNIWDSMSEMLRFNEENPLLEWVNTRAGPNEWRAKRIDIIGVVRDVHTIAFYKRLENRFRGLIELRVMERGEEAKNFLRIRSLKGQPHDARWHEIQIKRNGEAALIK